jgi:hypothetical protein
VILPTWMRNCPGCNAPAVSPVTGGPGPLYVADTGDWSCSGCSTYGVGGDFDEVIAGEYWQAEQAPLLRRVGTPEDAIASLRKDYLRDVVRNEQAVAQLHDWFEARHA